MNQIERHGLVALLPACLAIAVFSGLLLVDGGEPETVWYPAAIVLLALTAATIVGSRGLCWSMPRDLALAVAALTGFTLWSFMTVVWADDREIALDGAGKTLLYLVTFALFALLPWRERAGMAVVSLVTFLVGAIAFGFFFLPAVGDQSSSPFLFGRLADPVGYPNGNSALLLSVFWPAVVIASRREAPPLLRGALFAVAGGLLQLVIATQSRGAALAGAATAVLLLAVVPGRLRILATLLPLGVVALATIPRYLQVLDLELTDRDVRPAIMAARTALLFSLVLLFVLGLVVALVDRRLGQHPLERRAKALGATASAVAVVAVIAGFVATGSIPSARDRIDDARAGVGGSRFAERQLDGDRVELWRVAVDEFREHPILGIGVDNFAIPYVRERRTDDQDPVYPHSLPLKVASQTGIVGSLLFATFVLASGFAVVRSARAGVAGPWLAAAAAFPAVYWAVHGSIDWLWELPALTAPVLALLGVAGRIGRGVQEKHGDHPPLGRLRPHAPWAAVASCAVAALLLVPLWLSARNVELAGREWVRDPERALARLERAARLNPVADSPAVTAGAIASRREDYELMARRYADALERKADSWYTHLQLSLAQSQVGRRQAALASIRRARALNPLDGVLVTVERQLERGLAPDPRAIDRYFVEQARSEGSIR